MLLLLLAAKTVQRVSLLKALCPSNSAGGTCRYEDTDNGESLVSCTPRQSSSQDDSGLVKRRQERDMTIARVRLHVITHHPLNTTSDSCRNREQGLFYDCGEAHLGHCKPPKTAGNKSAALVAIILSILGKRLVRHDVDGVYTPRPDVFLIYTRS